MSRMMRMDQCLICSVKVIESLNKMPFTINPYTDRSFVLFDADDSAATKPYKEQLKRLGGKFHPRLRWSEQDGKDSDAEPRSAYVFSNTRRDDVDSWITGTLQTDEDADIEPRTGKYTGPVDVEAMLLCLLQDVALLRKEQNNFQRNTRRSLRILEERVGDLWEDGGSDDGGSGDSESEDDTPRISLQLF